IDHLTPFTERDDGDGGGSTCPGNGGPACGKHNRHKEGGYAVWRDPTGHWHTHQPDGTEIQ
ncbi:MAG: HNH endonuclease, partial [Acidimicrobiales bacterium]